MRPPELKTDAAWKAAGVVITLLVIGAGVVGNFSTVMAQLDDVRGAQKAITTEMRVHEASGHADLRAKLEAIDRRLNEQREDLRDINEGVSELLRRSGHDQAER